MRNTQKDSPQLCLRKLSEDHPEAPRSILVVTPSLSQIQRDDLSKDQEI